MKIHTDIQPDSGVISIAHIRSGQLLDIDLLPGHFVMIRQGALKVEYAESDGSTHIAAFLFAGEPVVSTFDDQSVLITALEDTWLCDFVPDRVNCETGKTSRILQQITRSIAAQALCDQRRMLKARRGSIEDRILWFLEDLANRCKRKTLDLQMSRDDIARYVETSPESVSRVISKLARSGVVVRETPRRLHLVA